MYVVGGQANGVTTARCEVYSTATNEWKELPSLSEGKGAASVCLLAGRWLYALGGYAASQN